MYTPRRPQPWVLHIALRPAPWTGLRTWPAVFHGLHAAFSCARPGSTGKDRKSTQRHKRYLPACAIPVVRPCAAHLGKPRILHVMPCNAVRCGYAAIAVAYLQPQGRHPAPCAHHGHDAVHVAAVHQHAQAGLRTARVPPSSTVGATGKLAGSY